MADLIPLLKISQIFCSNYKMVILHKGIALRLAIPSMLEIHSIIAIDATKISAYLHQLMGLPCSREQHLRQARPLPLNAHCAFLQNGFNRTKYDS